MMTKVLSATLGSVLKLDFAFYFILLLDTLDGFFEDTK